MKVTFAQPPPAVTLELTSREAYLLRRALGAIRGPYGIEGLPSLVIDNAGLMHGLTVREVDAELFQPLYDELVEVIK